MSQTTPEKDEIWVHRTNGRRVTICTPPGWAQRTPRFVENRVWYKAVSNPNGNHTALTKTTVERFLKQYRFLEAPLHVTKVAPIGGEPLHVAPWPQPINTSTLSLLASIIRARSQSLIAIADTEPWRQSQHVMNEIADALDEIAGEGAFAFDRSAFLSMDVSTLLIRTLLADRESAFRAIAAGDVYLDGQRVTEDDPITTVTRERFTVRCGERSAVVRVIG